MPLVGTVSFRIVKNSLRPLDEHEMSLFRDATLALLLGASGLLLVGMVRSLPSGNLDAFRSAVKLLGRGFPLIVLTVGAGTILGADRSAERPPDSSRLLSVSLVALATVLGQAVSLQTSFAAYRQMHYLTGESQNPTETGARLPISRMERCVQVFRFYGFERQARDSQLILIEMLSRQQNLRLAFDEIERVEMFFPELRMKAVSKLASLERLRAAAFDEKVFSNAWRDLETGPEGLLWLMDRWGRLFTCQADDLKLVRESPFLVSPETDSGLSKKRNVPDAVDFEFTRDFETVLILDTSGRVFAQGFREGKAAYRRIAEIPVSSRAIDLEVLDGEESFMVLEASGLVWKGLPVERNPLPEDALWDWDIGRALCIQTKDDFYVLDGFAGLHPFGNPVFPGPKKNMPYWGQDWAIDLEFGISNSLAVMGDRWGNLYLAIPDQDSETKIAIEPEPEIPYAVDIELDETAQEAIILSRGGTLRRVRLQPVIQD